MVPNFLADLSLHAIPSLLYGCPDSMGTFSRSASYHLCHHGFRLLKASPWESPFTPPPPTNTPPLHHLNPQSFPPGLSGLPGHILCLSLGDLRSPSPKLSPLKNKQTNKKNSKATATDTAFYFLLVVFIRMSAVFSSCACILAVSYP